MAIPFSVCSVKCLLGDCVSVSMHGSHWQMHHFNGYSHATLVQTVQYFRSACAYSNTHWYTFTSATEDQTCLVYAL